MRIAFTRWRSGGLFNRPSPRKRLLLKKKTSSGFEFVSGLADGASAMPAKWSRPVFSFRFYEGKISRALIVHHRDRGRALDRVAAFLNEQRASASSARYRLSGRRLISLAPRPSPKVRKVRHARRGERLFNIRR